MIKLEKRRYLALKVECEHSLDEHTILNTIHASIQRLFGEHGASQANIKLIEYLPEKSQIIIGCSHRMLEQVRASITSIIEVKGTRIALHVVNVSGTLKALSKKIPTI